MRETRWDCVEYSPPRVGYAENLGVLDYSPAIVSPSSNAIVDYQNSLKPRWGNADYSATITGKIVRIWGYETLPSSAYSPPHPKNYLIASVLDGTVYKLYSKYLPTGAEAPTLWTLLGTAPGLRDMNASKKPHLITFSQGKAYIKSFPDSGGDKYGTVVWDGSNIYPWGIPGPAESSTAAVRAARISGEVIRLTASVTASATTFNTTDNSAMPATPYDLWIGYEKVTVTAEPTSTSLTVTRGAGGTTAEAHDANEVLIYRDWDASDHQVEVKLGWKYAFAYVSITGQVSNRSDVEYNPDLMPSNTGPFYDLIPKIDLTLDSWFYNDTTTYPYLNMYRTTDGGGTFYFLEQVANPGTSTLTYEDDSFGTGASSTTYNDPVPDLKLDTARYAPSLTSNSVPTTVRPPSVVGTDTPTQDCWAMVTYANRIWIGIGNYLFFSSREETRDGVGEECFPSGNLGNFFILDAGITGLAATEEALYVGTAKDIWKLTGSTLDTFSIIKKFSKTGVYAADNTMFAFGGGVAFINESGIPTIIENDQLKLIGINVPSFASYLGVSSPNVNISYLKNTSYEFLIFFAGNHDDAGSGSGISAAYIYDLRRSRDMNIDFWHTPWSQIGQFITTAKVVSGDIFTTHELVGANYNSTAGKSIIVRYIEDNASYLSEHYVNDAGSIVERDIGATVTFNRIRHPAGNHLNALNLPSKDINFYGALLHRTGSCSVLIFYDNNTGTPDTLTGEMPYRIQNHNDYSSYDYVTQFYPANRECMNIKPRFVFAAGGNSLAGVVFMFDGKANP